MKLHNKKTGEILTINNIVNDKGEKVFSLDIVPDGYELIGVPLIKDEKLRKALWVWADENRIKKVGFKLDKGNTSCACYFYDESCDICEFGLKFYLPIDADKIYTITELCGEEE